MDFIDCGKNGVPTTTELLRLWPKDLVGADFHSAIHIWAYRRSSMDVVDRVMVAVIDSSYFSRLSCPTERCRFIWDYVVKEDEDLTHKLRVSLEYAYWIRVAQLEMKTEVERKWQDWEDMKTDPQREILYDYIEEKHLLNEPIKEVEEYISPQMIWMCVQAFGNLKGQDMPEAFYNPNTRFKKRMEDGKMYDIGYELFDELSYVEKMNRDLLQSDTFSEPRLKRVEFVVSDSKCRYME